MTLLVQDIFNDPAADTSGSLSIVSHHPTSDATLNYKMADSRYSLSLYRNDASYGGMLAAGAGAATTGNLAVLIDYTAPSDDQALKYWIKSLGAYNPAGESDFAFGDIGIYGRLTYFASYGTLDKYTGYGCTFRMSDNTIKFLKRIASEPTPGFPTETITVLASANVPALVANDPAIPYEFQITGTNPVNLKVLNSSGVTVLEYNDSASDRIQTGRKIGPIIRTPLGNNPYMTKYELNSIAATVTVPAAPTIGAATVTGSTSVSVAGTAPTNNGGAAIDLYRATASPSGITATSATLPVPVPGLATGTPQTFRLEAHNSAGWSSMSAASNSATPTTGNVAPQFGGTYANVAGAIGTALSAPAATSNFTDTDTLTYAKSSAGTAWPAGVGINAATGAPNGTPTGTAATTSGCKIRATDPGGLFADSNAFNFSIAPAAGFVPILTGLRKSIINAGQLRAGTFKLYVRNLASKAELATQAGIVVTAGATTAAFQLAGIVTGVEYDAQIVNEADPTDYGYFRFVAA